MTLHDLVNFFSVARIKKHFYVFKLFAVLLGSYGAASIFSSEILIPIFKTSGEESQVKSDFRKTKIKRSMPRSYYDIIINRNLFDSTDKPVPGGETITKEEGEGSFDITGPSVKTALPIKLIGPILINSSKRSLAIITGDAEKKLNVFMEEDLILKATIVKILRNKVFLKNNNRLEYIDIDGEEAGFIAEKKAGDIGVTEVSDGEFVLSRRELNQSFSDLSTILTQARVVPYFENGQTVGFRIFAIQPGSIYNKLGLSDNDIIERVNGELINDPMKGMQMFNQFKSASKINLVIKRDGASKTINYNIR